MQRKRLTTHFYKTESGEEPVRKWLSNLSKEDRFKVGVDIKTIEYGWPIGMPVCKPLGRGLYEVRTTVSDKRCLRITFCIKSDKIVLLHIFIKKSQQTPDKEIEISRKRMRNIIDDK